MYTDGIKRFHLSVLSAGNSLPIPSRYPKEANIYPGFPSDSVKHRSEGATDDTTGSYAYDQRSSNTLNGISNRKGLFISCEL